VLQQFLGSGVSLVLNGRDRIAIAGDNEEVNALAVDRAVGPRI
jgi:hypothetical protein